MKSMAENSQLLKPEVKEFFSFYCGHCFAFEPFANKSEQKAYRQGIELEKVHVDFLSGRQPGNAKCTIPRLIVVA